MVEDQFTVKLLNNMGNRTFTVINQEKAYKICLLFQSYLGILSNELLEKLNDEYETYNSVYNLEHNKDQILLTCRLFRLAKNCCQRTPENYPDLMKQVLPDNVLHDNFWLYAGIKNKIGQTPQLYPKLPVDSINAILELYNNLIPYYPKELVKEPEDIELDIVISFLGQWPNMLELSEENANRFWASHVQSLIDRGDKENSIARYNIAIRKFPNMEYYLQKPLLV